MFIEELKEDEDVEQHFVEAQIAQKVAKEKNVFEAEKQLSIEVQVEVQQATKVQEMAKAQQRAMEMEKHELEAIAKRKRAILDRTTVLEKGIKILNLK